MKHKRRYTLPVLAMTTATNGAFANGAHGGAHHAEMAAIGEHGTCEMRTVTVDIDDLMCCTPEKITQKGGEILRFMVKNFAMMREMPGIMHTKPDQVAVAPGGAGETVWHFNIAGQVEFAGLQPGHLDGGMKRAVTVRSCRAT